MNPPVLERLRQRLAGAPPRSADWPQAAVLVAVDALDPPLSVVLTQRADHMRLHAGEVAFPGGKCDPEDADYWETATREALEEIALPGELLEPLGMLDSLVTRTGIEVVPCVAALTERAALVPNPEEISAVFEAPLAFFAEPGNLQFDEFDYGGRRRRVPRYEWEGFTIWGITAAILVQLANLGFDAGHKLDDYWVGGQDGADAW